MKNKITHPKITVSKFRDGDNWVVNVEGIKSGTVIYFDDIDEGTISFGFDAKRFDPKIILKRR